MTIVYKIEEQRKKQNLSIGELSKLSGVSKATISEVENGKHDTTVMTICMIAEVLRVGLDDIVKWKK